MGRRESIELPPATQECLYSDARARGDIFKSTLAECKNVQTTMPGENCERFVDHMVFKIEGSIQNLRVGEPVGHGANGIVYSTNNPKISVKFGNVCVDKALIAALDGVHDHPVIPKEYTISTPMSEYCRSKMLVMDKLGDEDWMNIMANKSAGTPINDGFMRIAQLISEIKEFHSFGFTHNDLHRENIRVERNNPKFIGLIDLGQSAPFSQYEKFSDTRMRDIRYIAEHIQRFLSINQINFPWLFDGLEFFSTVPPTSNCPNYDLWIWGFLRLANSTDPAIPYRLQELLVPTYGELIEKLINSKISDAITTGQPLTVAKFPRSFRPPIPEPFYPSRIFPEMFSAILQMLYSQKIHDMDFPETRPYLSLDSELIYMPDARGKLMSTIVEVGNYYQSRPYSILYDSSSFKIEYRTNCENLSNDLFLMQREFGMLKIGTELKISLNAVWMSPPVKLPIWRSSKLPFDLSRDAYESCAENSRSHLRFMVTENFIGSSLQKSVRNIDSLPENKRIYIALKFAIESVRNFKHLHKNYEIVYGRMNPKNVLYKIIGDNELLVKFDEFEKSFFNAEFVSGCEECENKPSPFPGENPCYQTHWNLDGSRLGYRDDILNVLLVAAWIMTPSSRDKNFCEIENLSAVDFEEAIKQWKKNENIFGYIGENFTAEDGNNFRKYLEKALVKARAVESVEDRPDYKSISENLKNALKIAQKYL